MPIVASNLQRAVRLYLEQAYPDGAPATVQPKITSVMALPAEQIVPLELFETAATGHALRLGQPMYPFMKLMVEPIPGQEQDYLFRVDAHDQHVSAPPGSPDAAWLTSVRISNRDLVEKIEAAWAKAGLPTFKEYLRQRLAAKKAKQESK